MSDQSTEVHADEHADEHHGSLGSYMAVFVALCLLTGASFFTYTDVWRNSIPREIGWTFMMAVSCCKALLVIMFFMHLKYEANWKWVLTIPAGLMSIFLVMMLIPDIGMRMDNGLYGYSSERRRDSATPVVSEESAASGHSPSGKSDDH